MSDESVETDPFSDPSMSVGHDLAMKAIVEMADGGIDQVVAMSIARSLAECVMDSTQEEAQNLLTEFVLQMLDFVPVKPRA